MNQQVSVLQRPAARPGASKWLFRIRGSVPGRAGILLGLTPILVLLGVWWIVTRGADFDSRMISGLILPSPSEVAKALPDLLLPQSSEELGLLGHTRISLMRVFMGFGVAALVSLPLGVLIGTFGSVRAMCGPVVTASGYIPIAALVPLTMSLFGTDEKQKVIFLAMAFSIYLLPMVIRAIDAVPDVYLRTSFTLGASRLQVIRRVLIPIALPDVWHSMRLAFGVGWTYLVLTEVVVKTGGLGDLIGTAQRRGMPGRVWLVILIITLIAWLADLAWARLGWLLFPHTRSR